MKNMVDIVMPISKTRELQPIHIGLATNLTGERRIFGIFISCIGNVVGGKFILKELKFDILSDDNEMVKFDADALPTFEIDENSPAGVISYVIEGAVTFGTSGVASHIYMLDEPIEIKDGETIEVKLDEAGICCDRICLGRVSG